jgi:S-adenosylmethionine/arginine decarboxylase-like enzyme
LECSSIHSWPSGRYPTLDALLCSYGVFCS